MASNARMVSWRYAGCWTSGQLDSFTDGVGTAADVRHLTVDPRETPWVGSVPGESMVRW